MIKEILEKTSLHKQRAKAALLEIKGWNDFTGDVYKDFEKIEEIYNNILKYTEKHHPR